ncbi:hypothetical protein yc1106_03471 [Curvularia clavata]|uniref:Nucleoside phosphorylase domain-containing protein n=1 Tax=Curvularia clavata TaxID=95742 RepID=A0A9Q8Z4M0_CURCL|nr:hypothetical protein yc1106_03471 [Curvularia clavata]
MDVKENMSHQPGRDEYTVGWVCALPVELVAARSLLDIRYDAPDLEAGEKWDDTYYMGSIAGHNVVIACLPWRTGTTSAAALATRMQAKFRGIRLRLMVGIGGGVPSHQADIRLGDVVVSVPQHTYGGVVQYDMGKTTPTDVIRTGSLAPPPHDLLSAAVALQSDILMGESKLLNILSETERIPCLRHCESSDVLYEADYDHENGPTCEKCLLKRQVVRPQRLKGQEVVVHHGTIASGNQVMKSAAARDKISQRLGGVLCFEMEAAGLMNDFPCMVIRGISDYADSHKNDHWQGYAAGTAAAYAKELLSKIPPAQVAKLPRVDETMTDTRKRNAQSPEAHSVDSKRRRMGNTEGPALGYEENTSIVLQDRTRKAANEDQTHQFRKEYQPRQPLNEEQKEKLLESLKFDQIDERKNTIKRAHIKTCKWLLNSTSYLEWQDATKIQDHHGFLWIKGKAGAGKSTLMKFALEKACKGQSGNLVLSFFFNARGSELEKSTIGAYRSLLLKLLLSFPALQDVFETLYTRTSSFDANHNWSVESLKTLLEEAIQRLENVSVVCFIDALDECDETEIRDMVRFFEHVGDLSIERGIRFLICFSSRHYPHITIRNGLELVLEGQEGHDQDITNYIETELNIGKSKKAQQIRAAVQEKAAGIFMWVILVVGILNKESDRGRVDRLQRKLREIPSDLYNLFRDILTRDSNNKEELVLCIQWVLFAKQALSPEQLYHAILSGVEPEAVSAWDPEETDQVAIKRFILDCSKGLTDVTASKNQKVQFIHESVRDFLLKEEGLNKIWSEYKDNFLGQSHERLKQCCSAYLEIDLKESLDIPEPLPKASSHKAKELRLLAEQQFPLLEYAVRNIFYHSDLAEGYGISQAQFVDDSQRKLWFWVQLHNVFEKFEVRRYRGTLSLLYVLAELDCANLIRSHLPLDECSKAEDERYGCPLLAACALGNNAAMQVLSSTFVPASTGRDSDYDRAQCVAMSTSVQQSHRDFAYSKGQSLLFNAAQISPEWLMVRLLSSSRCISVTPTSEIQYVLEKASEKGFTTVVEKLLHSHAFESDEGFRWQDQPLLLAVKNGHESIVKLLVSKGANTDLRDYGKNSIHIASEKGFENIVMFLLDERPDLIESSGSRGETPLFLAVTNEHPSLAEALILRGANIHSRTIHSKSVVEEASLKGLKDIVILLLDRGVGINGQDHAFWAACWKGHEDIIELLLERGADVNMKRSGVSDALHVACRMGRQSIVELLLKRGAYVNAQSDRHGNALQAACFPGQEGIVELLLEKGADVNAQGGMYGNALQAACRWGHQSIVELLLKRGAYVNAQGGEHGNALQAACRWGYQSIVELLLEKGADVNAQGGIYGNALQAASFSDSPDIVELLLRRGAHVNARGGLCGSALAAARSPRVVESLKSYGAKLHS